MSKRRYLITNSVPGCLYHRQHVEYCSPRKVLVVRILCLQHLVAARGVHVQCSWLSRLMDTPSMLYKDQFT